jgi:hypothetical protein
MEHLYAHLRASGLIRSIEGYDASNLEIRSPRVLDMIETGDSAWEKNGSARGGQDYKGARPLWCRSALKFHTP